MTLSIASRRSDKVIGTVGRLLTTKETCEVLSLSLRTVQRAIALGDLQIVRVGETGRHVRVTEKSLERYIKDRLQKVSA